MSFFYDINGYSGPNEVGKDIGSVNASINISSCIQASGFCVSEADESFVPISEDPFNNGDNYWAGARDACLAKGMRLPTMTELATIHASRVELGMNSPLYFTSTPGTSSSEVRYVFFLLPFPSYGYIVKNQGTLSARCIK